MTNDPNNRASLVAREPYSCLCYIADCSHCMVSQIIPNHHFPSRHRSPLFSFLNWCQGRVSCWAQDREVCGSVEGRLELPSQGTHFFKMAIIYINAMNMTYVTITRVTHDHLHSIIHPVPLYDILDIRNIYMCYWQAQHESWELVAEEKTLYGQVESSLSSSLPSSSSSSSLPSSSLSTSRWRRQWLVDSGQQWSTRWKRCHCLNDMCVCVGGEGNGIPWSIYRW